MAQDIADLQDTPTLKFTQQSAGDGNLHRALVHERMVESVTKISVGLAVEDKGLPAAASRLKKYLLVQGVTPVEDGIAPAGRNHPANQRLQVFFRVHEVFSHLR